MSRSASARIFVHGIVKALLDREATEGTAQELSAVELKKRMDTLDALGGRTSSRFFIVVIAGLMLLGAGRASTSGRPSPGSGSSASRSASGRRASSSDYLNGALILIENQFGKGDVDPRRRRRRDVEDFSLRRTTLRDLDGVVHTVPNGEIQVASNLTRVWSRINQDVTVAYGTDIDKAIDVVDDVGAEMAARSGLEAARPRGAAGRAGRGARPSTASRSRSWAPSGPPTSGPRAATSASDCWPRSRPTASRSRARSGSSWPATRATAASTSVSRRTRTNSAEGTE